VLNQLYQTQLAIARQTSKLNNGTNTARANREAKRKYHDTKKSCCEETKQQGNKASCTISNFKEMKVENKPEHHPSEFMQTPKEMC